MSDLEKKPESHEQTNTAALIEQMAKMMTQMAAMQAAAMSNSQLMTQNVATTEGNLHSKPIYVKMDGTNYTYWCQAMEMYVNGRERMRHLTGNPTPPSMSDPEFHKWEVDDVVVKGWLINSLEPRLRSKYICHPTAKDVWKALEVTYYDGSDEVQVFALNRKVTHLKQEGKTIEEFYDELQALWQEIDFRCPNPMDTPGDIEKFNLFIQKARVYTFLDDLEDRFDVIRAQVLQMKPFPTVEQAFGHVRHEATRQGVMVKEYSNITPSSIALAAKGYKPYEVNSNSAKKLGFTDKSKLKCSNCGGTRHTREGCFELIGYPDWWKDPKKKRQDEGSRGRASLVVSNTPQQTSIKDTNIFLDDNNHMTTTVRANPTTENQASDPAHTYCAAAATGSGTGEQNKGKYFGNLMIDWCKENNKIEHDSKTQNWVIDSGATDHMTYENSEFREIRKPHKIGIINANGDMYPAIGTGDIRISPKFIINNVLLVPSLSTKLMSISQLTEDLNCVANLYPNHCTFQDIHSGEMIGRGTKRNGLYYLDELKTGKIFLTSGNENSERNKVFLWHKRLGHPSFGYMKKISPHLFLNLNDENFICETCIMAKSHRTSFGNSLSKCANPFELIHTDLWGPSPVNSKSGGKWYVIFVDDCTRMTWLYILKTKDEVSKTFKNFHKMITVHFEKTDQNGKK
jgi:GAG-pre-integrase domain/gag-polypeptide of LTR copia-type